MEPQKLEDMGFRVLGEELFGRDITVRRQLGKSGGAVPTYTISGIIYDADGSTAVAGAMIALGALTATSAADGTYTITSVPPGTSGSMTCTKAGYSWTAITIAAMSGNLTAQNYTNAWWAAGGCAAKCAQAFRARGAASLAASLVNLANPGTLDLTAPVASPTWDNINGWKSNGSQYFDTNRTPAAMNETYLVQYTAAPAGTFILFGVVSGGTLYIYPNRSASTRFTHQSTALIVSDGGTPNGNLAITNKDAYKNGSDIGDIGEGTATFTGSPFLFGLNNVGTFEQGCAANIQAYACYGTGLTPTELAAVAAAMAALNPT